MSESDFNEIDEELDTKGADNKNDKPATKEQVRMSLIEEKRERERLSRLMAFGEEL
jgi:hypothetical protein